MKYEKASAEIIKFGEDEFMTGSGNWDGGYCNNYSNRGYSCGHVTHCDRYGLGIPCSNWFECDEFGLFDMDMGFLCNGFA